MNNLQKNINKIICGDAKTTLKSFPENSIDLVITSPPYFQQRDYDGLGIGREETIEEYFLSLTNVFKECVRIIKPTGSIVFNIGDKYLNGNLMLIPFRFASYITDNLNVNLINAVTWVKTNPTPKQQKKKLVPATEPFFIFAKSKSYFFNKEAFTDFNDYLGKLGKKAKTNQNIGKRYFDLIENSDLKPEQKQDAISELEKVIEEVKRGELDSFRMKIKGIHALPYGGQQGGRQNQIDKNGFTIIRFYGRSMKRDVIESNVETMRGNIHPAIFPQYIIQEFLKLLTKEGDVILDPFMGSGTTGIVAKKMSRNYIGIDINDKYCDYAEKRILKTKKTKFQEAYL